MAFAVDLGLVLVVVLSIIAGVRDGFVDSLFSIASWLGGALVALYASHVVLAHLPEALRTFPGISILAGVLLFLLTFFVVRIVGMAITGHGKSAIGPIDRLLGVGIGMARGALLVAIIGSFMVAYLPADGTIMRKSHALPVVGPLGRVVAALAPAKIRTRMQEGWDQMYEGEPRGAHGPVTV